MALNMLTTPVGVSTAGWTTSAWNTINPVTLASLPAGATGVLLNFSTTSGGTTITATRMSCSSPDTFGSTFTAMGADAQAYIPAGLGSGSFANECDIYVTFLTGLTIYIVGYFDSRATFLANAVSMGALSASAYTTYNVPTHVAGASGALAVIVSASGNAGSWGVRQSSSSTDNFSGTGGSNGAPYAICGMDASGNMQARTQSPTPNIMVIGYITAGITWALSSTNVTPGTAGSVQNLATTSGAVTYLYQMDGATTTETYLLEAVGTTGLTARNQVLGSNGQCMCGSPPSINMSTVTSYSVFQLAYFTAPIVASAAPPSLFYSLP